jgi:hypothetical protein
MNENQNFIEYNLEIIIIIRYFADKTQFWYDMEFFLKLYFIKICLSTTHLPQGVSNTTRQTTKRPSQGRQP